MLNELLQVGKKWNYKRVISSLLSALNEEPNKLA